MSAATRSVSFAFAMHFQCPSFVCVCNVWRGTNAFWDSWDVGAVCFVHDCLDGAVSCLVMKHEDQKNEFS